MDLWKYDNAFDEILELLQGIDTSMAKENYDEANERLNYLWDFVSDASDEADKEAWRKYVDAA